MWLKPLFPHRLATDERAFRTAIATAQRQGRLEGSPLAAIEVIGERSPDSFIL